MTGKEALVTSVEVTNLYLVLNFEHASRIGRSKMHANRAVISDPGSLQSLTKPFVSTAKNQVYGVRKFNDLEFSCQNIIHNNK